MRDEDRGKERIRPFVERARRFVGWDLEAFRPTPIDPPEPWSYRARAAELLRIARFVLDMGTGGGELFDSLLSHYTGRAVATEPWSVNAPLAASRLRPRGVAVVRCRSMQLPFRHGTFDLVLNRHEELDPLEVVRVLSVGGSILTQQVGGNWWRELRPFFPRMQDAGDLFHQYREGLRASGLVLVQSRTHEWRARYRGLGEIAFLLCVAPWEIPGFDPLGRDLPSLLDMEEALSTGDGIVLTESLFLLEARRDR